MNCKHYQKLLHLNRPGEIPPKQRRKLQRHLGRCTACSQEKIKIEKADEYIAAAREKKPELTDPGLVSAGILHAIRGTQVTSRKNPLDFLSLPKTRLALIGISAILIGVFFLQEFLVLYRVSQLEKMMAQQPGKQAGFQKILTAKLSRNRVIRVFEESELLKNARLNDVETGGDRIQLNSSTLNALLKSYRELQRENRLLLLYLREKFPELEDIFLKDALDLKELEKIIKGKSKNIKYIHRL
jgi:hypothetical protein